MDAAAAAAVAAVAPLGPLDGSSTVSVTTSAPMRSSCTSSCSPLRIPIDSAWGVRVASQMRGRSEGGGGNGWKSPVTALVACGSAWALGGG